MDEMSEDRSKPPPGMMKMKHMGAYFIAVDHWPSGESDAIAAAWAFVDRIRADGERVGYARAATPGSEDTTDVIGLQRREPKSEDSTLRVGEAQWCRIPPDEEMAKRFLSYDFYDDDAGIEMSLRGAFMQGMEDGARWHAGQCKAPTTVDAHLINVRFANIDEAVHLQVERDDHIRAEARAEGERAALEAAVGDMSLATLHVLQDAVDRALGKFARPTEGGGASDD